MYYFLICICDIYVNTIKRKHSKSIQFVHKNIKSFTIKYIEHCMFIKTFYVITFMLSIMFYYLSIEGLQMCWWNLS